MSLPANEADSRSETTYLDPLIPEPWNRQRVPIGGRVCLAFGEGTMLQLAGSRSDSKAPRGKQTLCFHLPGDVFGIESGYFYRFTAEAIRETRVRIAKQERLFHGDSEASGFSSKELLKLIAGSLERAESHVLLGRQNALERVATFFTEMDRRLRSPNVLVLPMRRVDIADYLGLTHETVTRCFSTLRDWGILGYPDKSHREIVLHDKVQLAQLASGVDKHLATISHAVG